MGITLKLQTIVKVPRVPNFLLYDGGQISVGDISDEDLAKIAEAWREELVINAKRLRTNKTVLQHRAFEQVLKD
jgi:hypothetical protein